MAAVVGIQTLHTVVVIIAEDRGPGIPEHELAVLDADEETALEHGSGLGLWLVKWAVGALGGSVAFDMENGTTATGTRSGRGG